ncbi:MAG: LacI family transcriptional regulator, partial [Anaerolineae bacterium]|nr:LacI family transcriptional regulator [Anaerolineae bacterium]
MPTLQDVARKAGVSTATVSKVLSNTPYFTEATRLRVMQAVEELGYRPHLAARALSTGKTHIIAVVFPYVYEMMFTDPLVLSILQGVEEACYEHGYNMLLSTPRLSANGPDEPYQQLIQSGYLDGMIAIDNIPLASALRPALEHGLPGVTLGYHKSTYSVCSDDFSGGSQLMEHVLKLGHRDIGIIGVPDEMHFSILERLRGMQAVADGAGISLRNLPRQDGDFSIASGAACVTRLLEHHPDLTAIICVNDRMAMGAIQQARTLG